MPLRSARRRARSALDAARRHTSGIVPLVEHLVLALIAFVPLLAVDPGVVTSDTKTYLYLDPTRFLVQVASMWNPTVALGTVNHQYIGYLLPMGPFYAFFSLVHVPTWIAQRLWLGGILFAAGAGVIYLCRVLPLRGPGRLVAAFFFMLSPYFLQYAGRISVILLPWAGLPWMLAFTILSLRRGGWRYPGLFALVVALVSGINATAILYVGIGPALWLVYAVGVEGEGTWRRAWGAALRISLLTVLCCLWWIAGLETEAAYGVDVLKYTETLPATSATSSASEVIRGLGYWYFYGGDRLGPWTEAAVIYTQQVWLIALSYLLPVLAFLSAVLVRWRHRGFFILLVVVGTVLSVGAYPYTHPTPVGGLLKAFMSDTTAGLALRSTDRATPLVLIGLAMLVGSGVSALWKRVPWAGVVTGLVVAGLVVANNPAIFNGDAEVSSTFHQPASLPHYELQAIHYLNGVNKGTRVLAIPGDDFSAYRFGNTVDAPQPAYLTRPFVARGQQIMGSTATADTLFAMTEPIQTDIEDWTGLAPMARLMSAGNVLVEYDQAYEHYGVPQPEIVAEDLRTTPKGLSDPKSFGTPVPNIATISTLDEQDLSTTANPTWPSPLVTYKVTDPRPITRAESDRSALIVAGDATGLQDLANAGMLDTTSAIYYAGTLDTHRAQLQHLLKGGATLVVTDTNRKEAFRYDTLVANYGETETATDHFQSTTPSDYPIDLFPHAPLDSKSLATYVGAVNVTASSYGNSISYYPEDRPYNAIDGNIDTNWETGTFVPDPAGQWWQVQFPTPVTTNHITLTQPLTGDVSRWITSATLTFNGKNPLKVALGPSSRTPGGQTVHFTARTFRTLRITIDATSDDHAPPATAVAVGFSEVTVPGQDVVEVIKMPDDLLKAAGKSSLANRLVISMTRQRVSPYPPRSDPETTISRQFTLPTARTFSISGTATISTLLPDDQIDRLVGLPGATGNGVVAYSEGRLPGDLKAGAEAAIDGNPATAWQPGFGAAHQKGEWLEYNLPRTLTFSSMTLKVEADGRHSVPTALRITATRPTGAVSTVNLKLPAIADSTVAGATTSIPLTFAPLTGDRIKMTVTGVRLEYTTNYTVTTPTALPLGIAGLGIPGLSVPPFPSTVPGTCQSNLIEIDGRPITVKVVGSTATALDDGTLSVLPCGADASGITLPAGPNVVETQLADTPVNPSTLHCQATHDCRGWNIDQLLLDSAPGGGAEPPTATGALSAPQPPPSPKVTVRGLSTTGQIAGVSGARTPFELVLGQSLNTGWKAVARPAAGAPAESRPVTLGRPELVDGFANGWPVSTADLSAVGAGGPGGTGAFTVALTWTPQTLVWGALIVSGAAIALCLLLGYLPERWRHALLRRRRGRGPSRRRHGQQGADPRGDASRRRRLSTPPGRHAKPGVLAKVQGYLSWKPVRLSARSPQPAPDTAPSIPPVGAAQSNRTRLERDLLLELAGQHGTGSSRPGPEMSNPFATDGRRPAVWTVIILSVLVALAAGAISSPLIGLAAGVAAAGALVVPQARAMIAAVAVGLLVAAGASVAIGQALHPVPESDNWPAAYQSAAVLAWMAIVFLGTHAVVETARRLAWRRRSD